jgi:hypothetical protein
MIKLGIRKKRFLQGQSEGPEAGRTLTDARRIDCFFLPACSFPSTLIKCAIIGLKATHQKKRGSHEIPVD